MTIGWTQNTVVLETELTLQERAWYIQATHQFGWSKLELYRKIIANAHLEISLDFTNEVASYIADSGTNIKGFNRRGLYRMKQFYETYKDDEFVTPLVTQISWTNHLQIISGAKSKDERHFYLQLCAKERYSKRELERQIDSAYYVRCKSFCHGLSECSEQVSAQRPK